MAINNSKNEIHFNLTLSKVKTFTLRILSYPINAALILLLSLRTINFDFITSQIIRAITNLKISKITTTYITKLINRMITEISLRTIRLAIIISTINRETTNIILKLPINFIASQRQRAFSNISSGFSHFSFIVVVATFLKLSIFDSQTLATLDSSLLSQMDHS